MSLAQQQECKGSLAALKDVRQFTKLICTLPRHPAREVQAKLTALPASLALCSARRHGDAVFRDRGSLAAPGPTTLPPGPAAAGVGAGEAVLSEEGGGEAGSEAAAAEGSVLSENGDGKNGDHDRHGGGGDETDGAGGGENGLDDIDRVMSRLNASLGWPDHALAFLRAVLISRGGSKALNIRKQLRRYVSALFEVTDGKELADTVQSLAAAVGRDPPPPSASPSTAVAVAAVAAGGGGGGAAAADAADTETAAAAERDREAVQEHYRVAMHADKHLHILRRCVALFALNCLPSTVCPQLFALN